MKHQDPRYVYADAEALAPGPLALSVPERLYRWADALEAHGGALNALQEIEYLPLAKRRAYRAPGSPLAVAFADARLRTAGLAGDTLGDAMDFFGLTSADAHRLLCDCHYHGAMTGAGLAYRVRDHANRVERGSLWERARAFLASRARA